MDTRDFVDGEDDREPDIRMNFSVSRDEFPALTDAMLSIKKGRARKVRLATLATLGLLVEMGKLAMITSSEVRSANRTNALTPNESSEYKPVLGDNELADLLHEEF